MQTNPAVEQKKARVIGESEGECMAYLTRLAKISGEFLP